MEHVGAVSITDDVSEFAQLEYSGVTVMVLAATPYVADGDDAVTAKVFFCTFTEPST